MHSQKALLASFVAIFLSIFALAMSGRQTDRRLSDSWIDRMELEELLALSQGRTMHFGLPREPFDSDAVEVRPTTLVSPELTMDDPIPSSHCANYQNYPAMASNGSIVLVVWSDLRNWQAGQYSGRSEIWGVRIAADGTVLDPNGFVIASAPGTRNEEPTVTSNGSDFMVAWSQRDYDAGRYRIRTTPVLADGTVVVPDGNSIWSSVADTGGYDIAWDGSEYFIVYITSPSILGRRLDGDGNPTSWMEICTYDSGKSDLAVDCDSENCLLVWQDRRNDPSGDIYSARVRTSDDHVIDWGGRAVTSGSFTDSPDVAFGTDRNVYFVTWVDFDNAAMDQEIHGSIVTQSGTIRNPVVLRAADGERIFSPAVSAGASYFGVVWSDDRDRAWDIYSRRVVYIGTDTVPLTEHQMTASPESASFPSIAAVDGNFLTSWSDYDSSDNWDMQDVEETEVYGARFSESSGALLDDPPIHFSEVASNFQQVPAVAFDGTNYLVVWVDGRNDMRDIYGTRISQDGTVLDTDGIVISDAPDYQDYPAVAFDGSSHYLVVWQDLRNGRHWDVYGARVSTDGVVEEPEGIEISLASFGQKNPRVAVDPSGDFLVVWNDRRNDMDSYDVYGARVGTDGVVLDVDGIPIATGGSAEYDVDVAFDGLDFFLVWYSGGNIYGSRVAIDGTVVAGSDVDVSTASGTQRRPSVTCGDAECLVAWEDSRSGGGQYDIYAARVLSDGTVLDPSGFPLAESEGTERRPDAAFDGTVYHVAWEDDFTGTVDVLSASMSTNGEVIDDPPTVVSEGLNNRWEPQIAAGDGGQSLVVFYRYDSDETFANQRVRARFLTSLPLGSVCSTGEECQLGYCVDGVCCDSACGDDSPTDCLVCSETAGASEDGYCQARDALTPCEDGLYCTDGDQCDDSGTCIPGDDPCVGPDGDDDCAETCDEDADRCTGSDPAGSACEDGLYCTDGDQCDGAGTCVPGDDPCVGVDGDDDCAETCDEDADRCTGSDPAGSACEDGLYCTDGDQCDGAGTCVPGDDPCVGVDGDDDCAETCDEDVDSCTGSDPAGSACEDGLYCTDGDQCDGAGTCVPGDDPCVGVDGDDDCAETCDEDADRCTGSDPAGSACEDGLYCTVGDQCDGAGTCVPGDDPCVGPDGDDDCAETCDEDADRCTGSDPAGSACEDGLYCTVGDQCDGAGTCVPGDDPCVGPDGDDDCAESCDEVEHDCGASDPPGSACDDGLFCTGDDTCDGAGSCAPGEDPCPGADGDDDCAESCDEDSDSCTGIDLEGSVCEDGLFCTSGDRCDGAGTCEPGVDPCEGVDGDEDCAESCDEEADTCTGADPDATSCDDGSLCSGVDTCLDGVCVGAELVVCEAIDQCHEAGECDPATGECTSPPRADGSDCDDGDACTVGDTCQRGVCESGDPVTCTALDQCHDVGVCDSSTGLCTDPVKEDGEACDDGDACSRSDTCQAGVCVGDEYVECEAIDQCHEAGSCDPTTGSCSEPTLPDETPCDDRDACTQSDLCRSGECVGGDPVECEALDECHEAGECYSVTGECSSSPVEDGTPCTGGTCQDGECVADEELPDEEPSDDADGGCSCRTARTGSPAQELSGVIGLALLSFCWLVTRRR